MEEKNHPINVDSDVNNEYNQEPVFYCTHCLSLRVKSLDAYVDYCDHCGGTDIDSTDIFTWQKMYKARFGKDF